MKKNKAIKGSNIPMRSPIPGTIMYLMAADYYNFPEWAWTTIIIFLILVWTVFIISKFNTDFIDLFKGDEDLSNPVKKSKFMERLEQVQKQNNK